MEMRGTSVMKGDGSDRDAHLWGTGTALSLELCDTLDFSSGRGQLIHVPMLAEDVPLNRH